MSHGFRAAALCLALLALLSGGAAHADTRAERLMVGTWDCRFSTTIEGARASARSLTRYKSNGRSFSDIAIRAQLDGATLTISGFGTGTWRLDGSTLVETIETLVLTEADAGAFNLPARERAQVTRALRAEGEFRSDVLRLNRSRLEIRYEGERFACRRKNPS